MDKLIAFTLVILVLVSVISFLFIQGQGDLTKYFTKDDKKQFFFYVKETTEPLNGEVLINNVSLGYTFKGNISLEQNTTKSSNFVFRLSYNNSNYELLFPFPSDFDSFDNFGFSVTQENLFNLEHNKPVSNKTDIVM